MILQNHQNFSQNQNRGPLSSVSRLDLPYGGRGLYDRNFGYGVEERYGVNLGRSGNGVKEVARSDSLRNCSCSKKSSWSCIEMLKCLLEGTEIVEENGGNFVENFVSNYYKFGEYLEESVKTHLEKLDEEAFSSNTRSKAVPNLPKELGENELAELEKMQYEKMSPKKFVSLCQESKESSGKIQKYLKYCTNEGIENLISSISESAYELSFNKFSNYIIQAILEKSLKFEKAFLPTCLKNFDEMISDQYASRVLQKYLILKNQEMIKFSLEKLKKNFQFFTKDLSSVIFATKLISNCEQISELSFFLDLIKQDPTHFFKETNFIRILVSYFAVGEIPILSEIFEFLKKDVWSIINHKFGMYLVQKVLERDIEPHKGFLLEYCLENFDDMIVKKYPKYVMLRCVSNDEQDRKFCKGVVKRCLIDKEFLFEKVLGSKDGPLIFFTSLLKLDEKGRKFLLGKTTETFMMDFRNFEAKKRQCK